MKALSLTLLALLAVPAAAHADEKVADAPGARNLAAGGGYLTWSAPDGDGYRLTIRRPDGTISTPPIGAFATAPRVAISSNGGFQATKRVLAVYERAGDLVALDLAAGTERRLAGVNTSARETAPGYAQGSVVFVRRGGARPGVYYKHRNASRARRILSVTPSELTFNGSRVAYIRAGRVVVRRVSGQGSAFSFRAPGAHALAMTRYRAAWVSGDSAFATTRFGGSGGPHTPVARRGNRDLPGIDSITNAAGGEFNRYLDAEGVKTVAPRLF